MEEVNGNLIDSVEPKTRPDPLAKSSNGNFGQAVSSLLDTTMTKAAETIFGNIESKKSYMLFDNALSSLPVNQAQSSLSLQVSLGYLIV